MKLEKSRLMGLSLVISVNAGLNMRLIDWLIDNLGGCTTKRSSRTIKRSPETVW